mgnify:FL=1
MSTLKLFDVHAHVQFAVFQDDADLVIQRALDAGVWMINVGTQKDTSTSAVELAKKYSEGVYASVGLHPIHTEKSYHDAQELGDSKETRGFTSRGEDFNVDYYKKLAEDSKVVAIGECGLDYYRIKNQESKIKQEKVFVAQIELASEVKKPLMIHCRSAFSDLIGMLDSRFQILNSRPGVVHFFSGTKDDAKKLIDLGFSFSFGGVITFTSDYNEVVKYIPLERILLETDAPYVAPALHRGKRNEPAHVVEVAKKLAELKAMDEEVVAQQITTNAKMLFGI